ncbi:MAG: type I restriction endonuclease [Gammaproteobacteria bacterium]|nr:type I restriction endonuclease [Gammaproteobacteria bacterium]
MSIHQEIHFESEICADMAAAGWLYAPPKGNTVSPDAARYSCLEALFPEDFEVFLRETQPEIWETLGKMRPESTILPLLRERLLETRKRQGLLHVLHHGFEVLGLRSTVRVAQFKPASSMNPQTAAHYQANRLRVIRQVHYSPHQPGLSIDLVLFLNGLPVATAELKTDYTQAVEDAEYQYKRDRRPLASGQPEPLLHFPEGALVHFAVSNSEVRMTTHLAGLDTRFLPFNLGYDGGAGNPPNPYGTATEYLWKTVWAPESFLDILGRYLVPVRNRKKETTGVIFPRFHQLDVTRALEHAVLRDGPGYRYLVQHSAGSGKTHSIAWTAHFLASLHDAGDRKVFDSVIVVSDRSVLDEQLREAIEAHNRTRGVVAVVKGEGRAKSTELAQALEGKKAIIVCTLQTFPYALGKVQELAAREGKRFAVIADEAHSSQTNESAARLKVLLSGQTELTSEEEEDIDVEDVLTENMATRAAGASSGITYVAFTATPKPKTMELFGTRPFPDLPPDNGDNKPRAFHVYSMRQAIEEGFILDILQNYTSYQMAFQLTHRGRELPVVDATSAQQGIMGWVNLHSFNISQHVRIVVEHYRKHVAPLLNGKARAMVVTSSRLEAVRWTREMQKYIDERGYTLRLLVAFSGEVQDAEVFQKPVAETSAELNPGLNGRSIRTAFASGEYAILLVANKFQTGFDDPYLCAMYVHKRLDGIQAVQTLSRLNRAFPGKDTTYIVDFVNKAEDILEAFKPYYETAELADVSDPNVLLDLRAKLDAQGCYTDGDVNQVAALVVRGAAKQSALDVILVPVAENLLQRFHRAQVAYRNAAEEGEASEITTTAKAEMDALRLFKKDMAGFVRGYAFLSQMFDYGNTDIEKRAIFYKLLGRLLTFGRETESIDLSQLELTHHTLRELGTQRLPLSGGGALKSGKPGEGGVHDALRESLEIILKRVNEIFQGDISDNDKLVYLNGVIIGHLVENETLQHQAANNTPEQFAKSPDLDAIILEAIVAGMSSFASMSHQALESAEARAAIKELALGPGAVYLKLRERLAANASI